MESEHDLKYITDMALCCYQDIKDQKFITTGLQLFFRFLFFFIQLKILKVYCAQLYAGGTSLQKVVIYFM